MLKDMNLGPFSHETPSGRFSGESSNSYALTSVTSSLRNWPPSVARENINVAKHSTDNLIKILSNKFPKWFVKTIIERFRKPFSNNQ